MEGIYTGIYGQVKQTWALLKGTSIGRVNAVFGKYLYESYKSDFDSELYEKVKAEIDGHGHSGCSILIELQALYDLLGGRCLSDTERAYIDELRED